MPQRGKVKLLKFFDEPPTRPRHKYHRSRQTTPPPTLHILPALLGGCFGYVHILLIEGFIVHKYIHIAMSMSGFGVYPQTVLDPPFDKDEELKQ